MKYLENMRPYFTGSEKMKKIIPENIIFIVSSFQLFFVVFLLPVHDMYQIFHFIMAEKIIKIDFCSNLNIK